MREAESRTTWSQELRNAKHLQDITTKELAARAGVARGTVVKVLQGHSGILLRHIESVARALGLEVTLSITLPGQPAPPPLPVELTGRAHGVRFTLTLAPE